MHFIFVKFILIFLALQAFLISVKSFFIAGSSDKEIHTIISISSVLILKSFKGVHSFRIVLASPCNSSGL